MTIYSPLGLQETWRDRIADKLAAKRDEVFYVAATTLIACGLVLAACISI